ncbi:MAG: ferritin-like domain-containing protein [Gemmatimonadota bacterium]
MNIENLKDLFQHELKDLWSAEDQLTKALPKMIDAASNKELMTALSDHLKDTRAQKKRVERIAEQFGWGAQGHRCKGMEGLIAEGEDLLKKDLPTDVRDAAIIGAAQRVEHYEIAAYGTAREHAEKLGLQDAADELQITLEEEGAADRRLTQIAERSINFQAMVE